MMTRTDAARRNDGVAREAPVAPKPRPSQSLRVCQPSDDGRTDRMSRSVAARTFSAILWLIVVAGCSREGPTTPEAPSLESNRLPVHGHGEKPQPLLNLPPPEDPPNHLDGKSLANLSASQLAQWVQVEEQNGDFVKGIQLEFWALKKGEGSQYNFACNYGRHRLTDACFYWLQRAALEEGVDPDWAGKDPDLAVVRLDRRWPAIATFLRQCADYWAASGKPQTVLLLPQGYSRKAAIPVLLGLHGLNASPQGFVAAFQELADELNVAIIGVSGTIPRGPKAFVWSPKQEENFARIENALREVSVEIAIEAEKTVLFGFSQGAYVAGEVAARHPEKFAGAILLSPGTADDSEPGPWPPTEHKQGFVVVAGTAEHPMTIQTARAFAKLLRARGARVLSKEYPDMSHTFPPDMLDVFPFWVEFVCETRPKPSGASGGTP